MTRPPGDELRLAKAQSNQQAAIFRATQPGTGPYLLMLLGVNLIAVGFVAPMWFDIKFLWAGLLLGFVNFIFGVGWLGYRTGG